MHYICVKDHRYNKLWCMKNRQLKKIYNTKKMKDSNKVTKTLAKEF